MSVMLIETRYLQYLAAETRLGFLLATASEAGLRTLSFVDREDDIPASYEQAQPHPWLDALIGHLEAPQPHLDVPVDARGTAFQHRVWAELCRIPFVQTRTYKQVAAQLGMPTAVRAVARACATNPVAVVVPCHRVIGTNGALTGYRWGIERKKQLLELESAMATSQPLC